MCGFAGQFDLAGRGPAAKETLLKMGDTLVHRGPDSSGFHHGQLLSLAFRRLAIVDRAGGDQPMHSDDGALTLVCNGEIFNYSELRAELEAKGHRFRTRCDVEVLLHLYREHGVAMLDRLDGQFAFALYDEREQTLLIARDHVGILPVFYCEADGLLVFGSEIKALLQHPAVPRRVCLTGLDQVISLPGLVSPTTLFEGVQSLPGGHYLLVKGGRLDLRCYWDLDYPRGDAGETLPEEHYVRELRAALTQSVERRLQSDVPVGCYLSGGLDSSLLLGILCGLDRETPRHTFSISFRERELSEVHHQSLMVEHARSIHHELMFDWDAIARRLRESVYHSECPVKESYNTCSMALAEAARAAGVPVILSGEGADELFAGYIGYRFDATRSPAAGEPDLDACLEQERRAQVWGDATFVYERDFGALGELKSALYSPSLRARATEFDCFRRPLVDRGRLLGRHVLHRRSYLDFKLRLMDHLLGDHGDRMAMSRSVEVRYPFLSRSVIDVARRTPPRFKLNGLDEKYVLKRAASEIIPDPVIRRQKFGFHAPGSPYLLAQKVPWVLDMLSPARISRQGYFDAAFVEELVEQYTRPGFKLDLPFESDLLMIVLSFGLLLDLFQLPDCR